MAMSRSAIPAGSDPSGRHLWTWTRPGSTSSRPSKNPSAVARSRKTRGHAPEQSGGARHGQQCGGRAAAGRLPEDRHPVRVATEGADVVPYPLQGRDLVEQPPVGRGPVDLPETLETEAVVERHHSTTAGISPAAEPWRGEPEAPTGGSAYGRPRNTARPASRPPRRTPNTLRTSGSDPDCTLTPPRSPSPSAAQPPPRPTAADDRQAQETAPYGLAGTAPPDEVPQVRTVPPGRVRRS